jgi:hypothetical protein
VLAYKKQQRWVGDEQGDHHRILAAGPNFLILSNFRPIYLNFLYIFLVSPIFRPNTAGPPPVRASASRSWTGTRSEW